MTELIGAMCLAYDSTYSLKGHVPAMTAAARVIADALLTEPEDDEIKYLWGRREEYNKNGALCDYNAIYPVIVMFLGSRRAHLESKPKTPEERVRIVPNGSGWAVTLDGDHVYGFGNGTDRKGDAEIYRLGLIEQIKQKEAK